LPLLFLLMAALVGLLVLLARLAMLVLTIFFMIALPKLFQIFFISWVHHFLLEASIRQGCSDQAAWSYAFAKAALNGSAVAFVMSWASDASCLACSVSVSK
jgi:hypothetical protein